MEKGESGQQDKITVYQCPHCGQIFKNGIRIMAHLLICQAQKEENKDKEK